MPSPPDDLDFLDMEIEYAHTEAGDGREQTKGKAPARKASQREPQPKGNASASKSVGHHEQSEGVERNTRLADDFDVMDAIFGVENLTDVAEDGNEFGFGVEGQTSVSRSVHRDRGISPKGSVSQAHGRGSTEEGVACSTQDSIINDSGFLPRSPPAKKVNEGLTN